MEGVRRVQGEKTKRNNPAIRRRGHNAIFCPCLFVYLFCACCACLFKCVYPLEAKKPERSSTRQPGNQLPVAISICPASRTAHHSFLLVFAAFVSYASFFLSPSHSLLYPLSTLTSPTFSLLAVFPFTSQLQRALYPLSPSLLPSILPNSQ